MPTCQTCSRDGETYQTKWPKHLGTSGLSRLSAFLLVDITQVDKIMIGEWCNPNCLWVVVLGWVPLAVVAWAVLMVGVSRVEEWINSGGPKEPL